MLPVEGDPAMFDALSTEGARPELADFDLWTTIDSVRVFADDQLSVAAAVRDAAASIAVAVDAIADQLTAGGRLIYVGAGTGGRMAAVDAAEIGPSYGLPGRVIAVLAGGLESFTEGREYYEDHASAGAADVGLLDPGPDDVVFGVSASGSTPYVLGGVAAARAAGSLTIGFACTVNSELAAVSDLVIEVATGGEIIAGSTRLKAGSAQKVCAQRNLDLGDGEVGPHLRESHGRRRRRQRQAPPPGSTRRRPGHRCRRRARRRRPRRSGRPREGCGRRLACRSLHKTGRRGLAGRCRPGQIRR